MNVCLNAFIHLKKVIHICGFHCLSKHNISWSGLQDLESNGRQTKTNVPTMFWGQPSFFHKHRRKKRLLTWIRRWKDAGQKANNLIQKWTEYSAWKYKIWFLNAENSWTKNIKLNGGKLIIGFLKKEDRYWEEIQKDWRQWELGKIKAKVIWKRIEMIMMHKEEKMTAQLAITEKRI